LTNLKFDLPTEEEWEYAARGGHKSCHYRYSGSDNIDDVAWYRYNSSLRTHPVGEKQPNELGIYDMSGNVWEWTKSKAHQYNTDISPENKMYIRRGGSVFHVSKNCRVSFRYETERSKHNMGSGLRVVLREGIDKKIKVHS
jgi:formylglycine-generating enzyme required for sulfatase activity